ncbi:DUF2795 domain-containing protein [Microbacterium sp. 13-71-7]|jgi:hypothetical protein|uniref:DUF2795 domain-containing protein n=1 Tax=Microbacterium sp. 13-71-7 TaxID=1970399 RepID=UPI000BC843D5|nr:DUF2795 domain-containing protein [Microbacterium sp. 13-71-7]OZB83911.1 MAG: hypothetical protein B7X32_08880 [Microbacterium sp. 13-71-7]
MTVFKPNPIAVQTHLSGVGFPASREDLVAAARDAAAADVIVDALAALPERSYEDLADVTEALFGDR